MNNNKEKQNDWKEREIGALWKKSKGGSSYCTGYIVSDELGNKVRQRVIMFSNKTKSNENSPDFILYISKDQNTENEPKAVAAKPKPVKKEVKQPEPSNDDEIPEITD